jgi:hypothetical protein
MGRRTWPRPCLTAPSGLGGGSKERARRGQEGKRGDLGGVGLEVGVGKELLEDEGRVVEAHYVPHVCNRPTVRRADPQTHPAPAAEVHSSGRATGSATQATRQRQRRRQARQKLFAQVLKNPSRPSTTTKLLWSCVAARILYGIVRVAGLKETLMSQPHWVQLSGSARASVPRSYSHTSLVA